MLKVCVGDIEMNVETAGGGIPLVLLHGSFMNILCWDRQLNGLTDRFQLIAPDLRGHGETPCPVTPRSFDRTQDVVAVLDQLGIAQAIVAGHSMGGPIAIQLALDYPQRCLGLVLLATGPGPGDRPLLASPQRKAEAEEKARRLLELGVVEYFHGTEGTQAPGVREFLQGDANRAFFDTILERNNPEWLANCLRMEGCDVPAELVGHLTSHRRRRLPEIRVPVLFMVGSLDAVFLPVADLLRKEVPHTTIRVIPEATHMLLIDASKEVNRAVIDFGELCAPLS
jgi:pimeloyl-ACP methyl ester carboxylesterase